MFLSSFFNWLLVEKQAQEYKTEETLIYSSSQSSVSSSTTGNSSSAFWLFSSGHLFFLAVAAVLVCYIYFCCAFGLYRVCTGRKKDEKKEKEESESEGEEMLELNKSKGSPDNISEVDGEGLLFALRDLEDSANVTHITPNESVTSFSRRSPLPRHQEVQPVVKRPIVTTTAAEIHSGKMRRDDSAGNSLNEDVSPSYSPDSVHRTVIGGPVEEEDVQEPGTWYMGDTRHTLV